jgi:hypothetical protein
MKRPPQVTSRGCPELCGVGHATIREPYNSLNLLMVRARCSFACTGSIYTLRREGIRRDGFSLLHAAENTASRRASHDISLSISMEWRGGGVRRDEPSSKVGTVAPSIGASPPVSAGGCHRLMSPEEVAHVLHRLGDQVLRLLPGIQRHLCLRRTARASNGRC